MRRTSREQEPWCFRHPLWSVAVFFGCGLVGVVISIVVVWAFLPANALVAGGVIGFCGALAGLATGAFVVWRRW